MSEEFTFPDYDVDAFDDSSYKISEGLKYYCSGETYEPSTRYQCIMGQPNENVKERIGYKRFEDGNKSSCKKECKRNPIPNFAGRKRKSRKSRNPKSRKACSSRNMKWVGSHQSTSVRGKPIRVRGSCRKQRK